MRSSLARGSSPCQTPDGAALDAQGLPEFCRVGARLTPTADSDIQIEVWMPASGWNGKFVAVGNGGFAEASTTQARGRSRRRLMRPTARDTRRRPQTAVTPPPWRSLGAWASWKVIDFGWRAVHEMTVAAKRLVTAYYEGATPCVLE